MALVVQHNEVHIVREHRQTGGLFAGRRVVSSETPLEVAPHGGHLVVVDINCRRCRRRRVADVGGGGNRQQPTDNNDQAARDASHHDEGGDAAGRVTTMTTTTLMLMWWRWWRRRWRHIFAARYVRSGTVERDDRSDEVHDRDATELEMIVDVIVEYVWPGVPI